MDSIMKKILSVTVILLLTAWEGLFYVCNKPAWGETSQRPGTSSVQCADALSLLFSLCNSMNLQAEKLMGVASGDEGRGFSGPAGKGLPQTDVKIIKYTFSPSSGSQTFKSFSAVSFLSAVIASKAGSGPPVMAGLMWLSLLLFLCRRGKFCAYMPRRGIDAVLFIKKTFKNPHWLTKINEGFSFINNYSTPGGLHV